MLTVLALKELRRIETGLFKVHIVIVEVLKEGSVTILEKFDPYAVT